MTAQDQSAEREAFEAWYLRDHFDANTSAASLAWSAWQARAALSAREAPAQHGDVRGTPLGEYQPQDQAFYRFWYGHMLNDLMQPPLSHVSHATARYIWDAAIASSAPALEGWRDIETAPRDGSHVHLYAPELQFFGFYAVAGWCYVAPGVPLSPTQPTHWRESPKPPVAPTTEGSEK